MSSGTNKFLKKLQEISDESGLNNSSDTTEIINTVLKFHNKVYFSDLAYFVQVIKSPSGKVIGLLNVWNFVFVSVIIYIDIELFNQLCHKTKF